MLSHDAESNLSSSSFMRLIIVLQCHSTVLVHSNVSSDQSLTRLRPFFTSVRTFTQSLSAVMLFLQVRLVLSHIFIHLSFPPDAKHPSLNLHRHTTPFSCFSLFLSPFFIYRPYIDSAVLSCGEEPPSSKRRIS